MRYRFDSWVYGLNHQLPVRMVVARHVALFLQLDEQPLVFRGDRFRFSLCRIVYDAWIPVDFVARFIRCPIVAIDDVTEYKNLWRASCDRSYVTTLFGMV